MIKIGKPTGLIRFASINSIKEGVQKLVTPRTIGYGIVLTALVAVLGFTLFTRSDIETTVLKVPGTLYQKTEDGFITNLYNIEFVNKTFDPIDLELRIESPANAELSKVGEQTLTVPAQGLLKSVYFIKMPAPAITEPKTAVVIGVYRNNELVEQFKTKFIGPVSKASEWKR